MSVDFQEVKGNRKERKRRRITLSLSLSLSLSLFRVFIRFFLFGVSFVPCARAMLQGCFSARSDARRVFQGCSMIPPATPERPPRHPACHPDSWAAIQGRFSEFCPGCDSWKTKKTQSKWKILGGGAAGHTWRSPSPSASLPPPASLRLPPSLPVCPFPRILGRILGKSPPDSFDVVGLDQRFLARNISHPVTTTKTERIPGGGWQPIPANSIRPEITSLEAIIFQTSNTNSI